MNRVGWQYEASTGQWVLARHTADGAVLEVFSAMPADTLTAISPRVRLAVANAMQVQHGVLPPARIFDGPPDRQVSMTCGKCWVVTFDPDHAKNRWCPTCEAATETPPA